MNNLLLFAWGAAATFTGVDGEQGDVSGVAAGSWRCKMRRVSFDARVGKRSVREVPRATVHRTGVGAFARIANVFLLPFPPLSPSPTMASLRQVGPVARSLSRSFATLNTAPPAGKRSVQHTLPPPPYSNNLLQSYRCAWRAPIAAQPFTDGHTAIVMLNMGGPSTVRVP